MPALSCAGLRGLYVFLLVALCGLATATAARAAPVDVTYTVVGSSGNYTLDFKITNNIPAIYNQSLYFLGVDLSAENVVGIPTGWSQWINGDPWTNAPHGGSSRVYDNNWATGASRVDPGLSLDGFKVQISDVSAPTSVHWFVYAFGGTKYMGDDAFHAGINPGFEGVASASVATVPGPVAGAGIPALMALGGFVWARRRKAAVPAAA